MPRAYPTLNNPRTIRIVYILEVMVMPRACIGLHSGSQILVYILKSQNTTGLRLFTFWGVKSLSNPCLHSEVKRHTGSRLCQKPWVHSTLTSLLFLSSLNLEQLYTTTGSPRSLDYPNSAGPSDPRDLLSPFPSHSILSVLK